MLLPTANTDLIAAILTVKQVTVKLKRPATWLPSLMEDFEMIHILHQVRFECDFAMSFFERHSLNLGSSYLHSCSAVSCVSPTKTGRILVLNSTLE